MSGISISVSISAPPVGKLDTSNFHIRSQDHHGFSSVVSDAFE